MSTLPDIQWEPLPVVPPRPGVPAQPVPTPGQPPIIWDAMPPMDDGTRLPAPPNPPRSGDQLETVPPPNMGPGAIHGQNAPPGTAREPGIVSNTMDLITGHGRAIDPATKQPYREIRDLLPMLPEEIIPGVLTGPKGNQGRPSGHETSAMMAFEPDEPLRAAWIAKRFPNAKVSTQGREIIVDIPDINPNTGTPYGKFTMNQIGLSPQDLDEIVQEITLSGPATRLATIGRSLWKRAFGAGVGAAGTEVARQGASQFVAGTDRKTSLPDAAVAGSAAALLTGMGEHAFQVLRRYTAQRPLIDASGQQMTAQARAIFQRLGIDPDQVSFDALRQMEMILPQARSPAEAYRLAQARSLGVTPTRGDITGERAFQALEGRVATGHPLGPVATPAENRLRALKGSSAERPRGDQGAQIDQAIGDVVEGLSRRRIEVDPRTGRVTTPRGEFFGEAQQRLADLESQSRAQWRSLYQQGINDGAAFNPDKVRQLSFALQRIKEGTQVREAHGIADELADLIKTSNAGGVTPITLRDMEVKVRQKISELGGSIDPRDRAIAGQMRRAYDQWEQGITQADLVAGRQRAFDALREGRDLRMKHAANFEDDPAIAAILRTERMNSPVPGGSPHREIDLNPSEAVDAILGGGTRRGSADTALRLRNILGENSNEWMAVKAEMAARLMEGSPTTLLNRLNDLVRKNRELVDVVFGREDLARLRTLADVANFTGYRPSADVNYRGLAYDMARSYLPHKFGISNAVSAATTNVRPGVALQPIVPPVGPGGMVGASVIGGQQITPDRMVEALRALSPQPAPPARPQLP